MADSSQNSPDDHPSSRNPFRNALKNFRKFLIPKRPVVYSPVEQRSLDKSREQQLADIREQPSTSHEQPGEIKLKELNGVESVESSSSEETVFGYIRNKGRRFSHRFISFVDKYLVYQSIPLKPAKPAEPTTPADPAKPSKERPTTWRGRLRTRVDEIFNDIRNLGSVTKFGQREEDTTHLLTPEHEAADKTEATPKESIEERLKGRKISDSDYPILEAKVSVSTFSSSEDPTEIDDM